MKTGLRRLTALVIALVIVFGFTTSSFAYFGYNGYVASSHGLAVRGMKGYYFIAASKIGEDVKKCDPDEGIEAKDGGLIISGNRNLVDLEAHAITFEIYSNCTLGNHRIDIYNNFGDKCTEYIFVIDDSAPVITDYAKTKSSITINWDGTDVGRYQVQYRIKDGSWKTVKDFTAADTCRIKGLKAKRTYEFRVRAVNYDPNYFGEVYGNWSSIKTIKTKS